MQWHYEKLDEEGKVKRADIYTNDCDGKITGRYVMNVKAWFDENPEERIARGWTKHITWEGKEIKEKWPHEANEALIKATKRIDEYTIEDDYHVVQVSEAMLAAQELLGYEVIGDADIEIFGI